MKSPTIRDVAQRAGVSVATVSRVLNSSKPVSEETRQRVMQAIDDLNFSRNLVARQLSMGKTFTIGVVTPFFTYPSFTERLAGIQEGLDDSGYTLVLYSIRYAEQLRWQLTDLISHNRVDGLIVLSLPFDADAIKQTKPGFPVVAVDTNPNQHFPHIVVDDVAGGELATEYLIERGHRHIGFVGDQLDEPFVFTSSTRRFEGFQRALRTHKLPVRPEWYWQGDHSHKAAKANARRILGQGERPSAIFASLDTYALAVLAAAEELGLRVPDDVAVMGFDDIDLARHLRLTTVRQHLFDSGKLSAALMLDWLQTGEPDRTQWHVEMPLEIIDRSTV